MPGIAPTEYVLDLAMATDPGIAGAKAANLARLMAAGFPVPEGAVLTVSFIERLPADGRLPSDLAGPLAAVAECFEGISLAVRSSGVAEDLPGASYAGQYDTVLDVQGRDALLEAVRRCAASASAERVMLYRAERGETGPAPLAVLVQSLVLAEAAGVAFSANPLTGDRNEVLVSAVRGLGDRLVSGAVSPDEWVVRGAETIARATPEAAIASADVLRIADLARRVEQHCGSPQDIEWAISGDALYLLQARPITTLPAPTVQPIAVPVDVPKGFWEREASHYPKPLSPMMRSLILPLQNAALARVFADFGLMADGLEHREIGGWMYNRLVPPGGRDRTAPPRWVMRLLLRAIPDMRRRTRTATNARKTDLAGRLIDRWYAEWQPAFAAAIEAMRGLDLSALSGEELHRHLYRIEAFVAESVQVHFLLHGALAMTLGELGSTCRDRLGWDAAKTFELLNGLSERSTEPAWKLAELARLVNERAAVRPLLEWRHADAAPRLRAADPEFADAFEAYQREYGCRALRYEVAEPTVAEAPELVLALLRDQLARGYDPQADGVALAEQRQAAAEEARALLQPRPAAECETFECLLERGRRAYPVREDNESFTVSAPLALLRYAVLEVGRRLADREQIAARDDVFFLEWAEAREALRDGAVRRDVVGLRRSERAWVEAHPGPRAYGQPPPAPPLDVLPEDARFAMEAIIWTMEQIFGPRHQTPADSESARLHGTPASPGVYTGPVRVVMDESEFEKIEPGDVLVCPITSPVWAMVFPSIGALVTDSGGVLSHPAIIAREYRVPAVVAAGSATTQLRDGDTVTVDGSSGTVTVKP